VVIGSVGRLVEQKDYPTQLRAFALAVAHVPSLRMVIAGDGPLRQSLEEMARELAVADRIRFLGHWDNVPRLLRSVDLFVLASKFEPFGVALLEAKAAALPIVATAVNEIPEIIEDGATGLLTPPENAASLADLIIKLARDDDFRLRLGTRARRAALQHTLDTAVAAHERLYDAALQHQSQTFSANPYAPESLERTPNVSNLWNRR
jgi:glycosyltransferase involved in cell wall biosynthesis